MISPQTTAAITLQNIRQEIVGIDQQVPLLDGSTRTYVYLDNAASTPAFRGVQQKVDEFMLWYSSVHRGTGFKSILSTHAFETARETIAAFVGANLDDHCVIFVKNTTEAINKLANRIAFRPGDVVLVTTMEHHSNDLPWRPRAQVVHVGTREDGSLDVDDLAQKLDQFAGRVRLVAATGASNITGFVTPIHDIAEMVHAHGAMIAVDTAQLAPHRAVDICSPGSPRCLDFITLSAHKMYAPYGAGALIGPKGFFAEGIPDYSGGGTVSAVTLDEVHWAGAPGRDEAGTPNVVGAIALAASIHILTQIGMDAVAEHERVLTAHALRKFNALDGVRLFGPTDPDCVEDRLGVITFQIDGVPHTKVAAILGYEYGIGVRNGLFCAHPYVLRLLGFAEKDVCQFTEQVLSSDRSELPGMVRASFGCYNTLEEIDYLVEMLERIIAGDYQGDYVVDKTTGDYVPRGFDPAVLDSYFTF